MRTHPENRERFHELLRFHMQHYRKGKEPKQVLADMRTKDIKEQSALLSGNCEMEIVVTHAQSCDSRLGGFLYSYRCDCTPTREIKFVKRKKKVKLSDGSFSPLSLPNPFIVDDTTEENDK